MLRRCRGIRGDVGIAPYEIARRAEVKRREGQSPSPTDAQRGGGGKTAGGRFLARRLSISRKCALHLGESVGIIVEKTDVCSYAGHTSVVT